MLRQAQHERGQAAQTPFQVTAKDAGSRARCGLLQTAHGAVHTPAFMPVGTQGTVKTLTVQDLKACGVEIVLGNVYHLSLRPGREILERAGGLHKFMAWDGPLLTDSGGYQLFSLAAKCRVREEGASFASHVDGSLHTLTPEGVIAFQVGIGVDIAVPLDQCVPYPCERAQAQEALERTTRWAERSKQEFTLRQACPEPAGLLRPAQDDRPSRRTQGDRGKTVRGERVEPRTVPLLFGIVQGATYPDLRRQAAERLLAIGFDGYCLGGFSVGEPRGLTYELLPAAAEMLPQDRARYLMGVGEPMDLVEAVEHGVDLFDCVVPTRHGRNGVAYTSEGRLNLRNAVHAADSGSLDPRCRCEVCRTYSRLYLRHLFQAQEILGLRLLSYHNVWFYSRLMAEIRAAIAAGGLKEIRSRIAAAYANSERRVIADLERAR